MSETNLVSQIEDEKKNTENIKIQVSFINLIIF